MTAPVFDAEFVSVSAEPPAAAPTNDARVRPAGGYGRRTVAGPKVEAARAVLEAVPGAAHSVAAVARGVGADDVAERAERVAELAAQATQVVDEVPHAVASVEVGTRPLREALGKLYDSAKRAGVVGGRREPRQAVRAARPAKGA